MKKRKLGDVKMKKIAKTLTALTIVSTLASGMSIFANAAVPDNGVDNEGVWETVTANIGNARLSFGTVTVSTNSLTGGAHAETATYEGKATKISATIKTTYNNGAAVGPSSTNSATNTTAVRTDTVRLFGASGWKATASGSITYNGETQTATVSKSY